jgi:hypothetical protein
MSVHTKFETANLKAAKLEPARRTDRKRVLMMGELISCGGTHRVRIRDFSSKGAQIVCEGSSLEKCDMLLRRGDLCVAAHVAWIKGDEVGLTFYREISAEDLATN